MIKPMLAVSAEDVELTESHYCVQLKFDGVRALVYAEGGMLCAVSRNGKPFSGLETVFAKTAAPILETLPSGSILDGELVFKRSKGRSKDFNEVSGLVRRQDKEALKEKSARLVYLVYDFIPPKGYEDMTQYIRANMLASSRADNVRVGFLANKYEITEFFESALANGFEGVMLRDPYSFYEAGKRSKGLIKMKKFDTDEFAITGYVEGKGKLEGKIGAFKVKTPEGKEFSVKVASTDEELAHMWNYRTCYINAMLTVKFQGKSENGIPRFPIGLGIRDYE